MSGTFNIALKYILLGLITGLLIRYLPELIIQDKYILIISFLVSISYALLDRFLPSVKNI